MEPYDNVEFPMIRASNPHAWRVRWMALRYRVLWALFGRPDGDEDLPAYKWFRRACRRRAAMALIFPLHETLGIITRSRRFLTAIAAAWRNF